MMRNNNEVTFNQNDSVYNPMIAYLKSRDNADPETQDEMNEILEKVHDMSFENVLYHATYSCGLLTRAANAELAMRETLNIC